MRRYIPNWEQYGIDRERYMELIHFCRQYPLWKQKLQDLTGPQAVRMDSQPHGTTVGNPTLAMVEKRERFVTKVEMIDKCATDVDDGSWARALIMNICYGQAYSMIDPVILPASGRNVFFKRRKEFFILLNERTDSFKI